MQQAHADVRHDRDERLARPCAAVEIPRTCVSSQKSLAIFACVEPSEGGGEGRVPGRRRFKCNMCGQLNDVAAEHYSPIGQDGRRTDADSHPQLSSGSVEFIAPQEYMARPAFLPCVHRPQRQQGWHHQETVCTADGLPSAASTWAAPAGAEAGSHGCLHKHD